MEGSSFLRREARSALELFAACGFAITQPVLSVYGKSPDTFIYHDAQTRQIVLFALVVGVRARRSHCGSSSSRSGVGSQAARRIVHGAFLVGLAALFAVQLAKHIVTPVVAVVVLAAVVVGSVRDRVREVVDRAHVAAVHLAGADRVHRAVRLQLVGLAIRVPEGRCAPCSSDRSSTRRRW